MTKLVPGGVYDVDTPGVQPLIEVAEAFIDRVIDYTGVDRAKLLWYVGVRAYVEDGMLNVLFCIAVDATEDVRLALEDIKQYVVREMKRQTKLGAEVMAAVLADVFSKSPVLSGMCVRDRDGLQAEVDEAADPQADPHAGDE